MANRAYQFKRILCVVDFSSASLRAFDLAIRMASMQGSCIHVLHVIPRIVASLMDIPITTSRWTTTDEEKAKRELPKLQERARKHGISATTEIRTGDIDLAILKVLKETRSDLLAMGTHGRRGFELWALGSVTERMLRRSPIPILVTAANARTAPLKAIRRILVASDFSQGTSDAIGYASGIADQTGASIVMLHVIQDRSAAVDWSAFPDQTAAIRERLEGLIPRNRRPYVVEARVDSGEPYRVILNTVRKLKPSLVVLNTHGHGFLNRILIGSTAERVVRGGAGLSPLLLIPPNTNVPSRRNK
jgi:nucleotide-binding universal stress UspA family protein